MRLGLRGTSVRRLDGRARSLLAAIAMLGAAASARAHDPFEITTAANVSAESLVLEVTMARSTALAVAAGGRESPTFAPAEFDRHRGRLLAAAPALFAVEVAGHALALRDAQVTLGVEQDVVFHLVYARPAAGRVRLVATHVARLGDGYGNVFVVRGDGISAEKLLTAADAGLEWTRPAVSPDPTQARRLTRLGFLTGAVVVVIALAWWSDRRAQPRAPIV